MKGKLNRQNVYLNLYENYYNAHRHEKSIVQVGKKIVKIILKICIVEIPSRTKPSNCNNPENDKLIIAYLFISRIGKGCYYRWNIERKI